MAYTPGASNLSLGSQQVNVHPSQQLTSLNANKLLLGVIEAGIYNMEVEITSDATNIIFTIKEGATFVFKKLDADTGTYLLGKFYFQEDAEVSVPKTTLEGYSGSEALLLIASWAYDIAETTKIYCTPMVIPYSVENMAQVESENDLILAVILNHQEFIDNGSDPSYYKVAYQEQFYINPIKGLYEISSGFPIKFGFDGKDITVGSGNCIMGDTYIHNTTPLNCATGSNWPSLVTTANPELYHQIDVLRIKTERDNSGTNTPYLGWESFLKLSAGFTNIREFIDGFDFTWEDYGYNLLFVVRSRNTLAIDTPIWPSDCLIVNPFTPQIGSPETLTRFKLPVY